MLQLVLELIYNHPIIFNWLWAVTVNTLDECVVERGQIKQAFVQTQISCSVYFYICERLLTAACVSALQVVSESTQHQQDIM